MGILIHMIWLQRPLMIPNGLDEWTLLSFRYSMKSHLGIASHHTYFHIHFIVSVQCKSRVCRRKDAFGACVPRAGNFS